MWKLGSGLLRAPRADTPLARRLRVSGYGRMQRPAIWAVAMLAIYTAIVLPSVGQALLESHAYRQTQTAYTAVLFARDGVDMLHPPLPVLGPPGTVPLEFPLFQLFGSVFISAGLAPDPAMRVTGLATFLLAAWLVYLLGRRLIGQLGALVALAAFLFNPFAILYGRASLIEWLAVAGGLLFVLCAIRWMETGRPLDWALAFAGATLVLLVKLTTAPLFLLPVLAWRSRSGSPAYRRPMLWTLFVGAMAIGLAWSAHADSVRSANLGTEFLASRNSVEWFFGSLAQRLELDQWRVPLVAMLALTGSGLFVWFGLAIKEALGHPLRDFLVAAMLAVLLPPMVLFNLYAIHDYYYAAVAPFVAIVVGLGAVRLFAMPRTRVRGRLLVGLSGAWLATLVGMAGTWSLIYRTPVEQRQVLASAEYIRSHSDPTDWVVIEGFGWNSTFLYYARRRGFADPTGDNLLKPGEVDTDAILDDPIYGPYFLCEDDGTCTVSPAR